MLQAEELRTLSQARLDHAQQCLQEVEEQIAGAEKFLGAISAFLQS